MQVEERLRFYDDGVAPRKNATVMAEAMEQFKEAGGADAMEEGDVEMAEPEPVQDKPKKKKKKRSVSVRFPQAQLSAQLSALHPFCSHDLRLPANAVSACSAVENVIEVSLTTSEVCAGSGGHCC